jgi:hypothetical protein
MTAVPQHQGSGRWAARYAAQQNSARCGQHALRDLPNSPGSAWGSATWSRSSSTPRPLPRPRLPNAEPAARPAPTPTTGPREPTTAPTRSGPHPRHRAADRQQTDHQSWTGHGPSAGHRCHDDDHHGDHRGVLDLWRHHHPASGDRPDHHGYAHHNHPDHHGRAHDHAGDHDQHRPHDHRADDQR